MLVPGLTEGVRRGEDRDPAVGDLGGDLHRLASDRTEEDRDGVPNRMEVELESLALAARERQVEVLAVVLQALLARHDLAHDLHVLARAAPWLCVRDAVPTLGDLRAGWPEAEHESPTRKRIDRAPSHRGCGGRAGGHLHDRCTKLDRLGLGREPRQDAHHVGAVRLGGPHGIESRALRRLDDVQRLVTPWSDPPVAEVEPKLHRWGPYT